MVSTAAKVKQRTASIRYAGNRWPYAFSYVLIIRMRDVPAIDSTALHALGDIVRRSRKDGTLVLLSDVHAQPMVALGRSDVLDELGDEHVFGNIDDALNHARAHLGLPVVPRPAFAAPTVARETPVDGVAAVHRAPPTGDEE